MKTLWELVCDRPNEEWDVYDLSKNMAISIHDIFLNPNGPPNCAKWEWDINEIAYREDVTWELIISDKNPWKENLAFNYNPNITWDTIINSPERNWKPEEISANPHITWKIMFNNPHGPFKDPKWKWEFCEICKNLSMTFNDIYGYIDKLNVNYTKYYDYREECLVYDEDEFKTKYILDQIGQHIPLLNIIDNIDLDWNWRIISSRDDLTWNFIKTAIDSKKEISWFGISRSSAITWDIVLTNLHLPWDWTFLARNPSIMLDVTISTIDENYPLWEKNAIETCNSHVSIVNHPNIEFNCKYASESPNITIKDIIDNPHIKWNYEMLSANQMNYWFSSNNNRQKLAKKTSNLIKDELENRVYHPSNHPAAYLPMNEARDHPLYSLTPQEVKTLHQQIVDN